jgi:N6-L-threonylcarbamoyladenine synthase
MHPIILAIESSCDETSASVISNGKVLNNIIATQAIHQKYGGVVPELASRAHQQNIVAVVSEALSTANTHQHDLSAIAFTRGPGLIGSILMPDGKWRAHTDCFGERSSGNGGYRRNTR